MTLQVQKPKSKIYRNLIVTAAAAALAAAAWFGFSNSRSNTPQIDWNETSAITRISELATLECYYHNVLELKQEAGGLLSGLGVGYKKYWLEYEGTVTVGIDASKVQISQPDAQGNVQVYIPEVQILSVDINEDSIGEPVMETGFFTSISAEEKAQALAQAQSAMAQSAKEDSALLNQAFENARLLIKRYIEKVGDLYGTSYTVTWVQSEEDSRDGI
jgi:hypothetical protein